MLTILYWAVVIFFSTLPLTAPFYWFLVRPHNKERKQFDKYISRYEAYGGKQYVPQRLCADKETGGVEKFWEGPPAPRAADIEKWEQQQRTNRVAREQAWGEVYDTPYLHV
jgi:hypothetical protein